MSDLILLEKRGASATRQWPIMTSSNIVVIAERGVLHARKLTFLHCVDEGRRRFIRDLGYLALTIPLNETFNVSQRRTDG